MVPCKEVAGEHTPPGILTELVNTNVLQRHLHRFNMITACDTVFAIAPAFVIQFNCGHFQHVGPPPMSARAACSDVTSAPSPQPFVFGQLSALVEPT